MPFKSEKQRRYLYANEPEVAKRWSKKYGDKPMSTKRKPERVKKSSSGIPLKAGKAIPHPKTKTKPATSTDERLRRALQKKKK